jgi:hypothetical protein
VTEWTNFPSLFRGSERKRGGSPALPEARGRNVLRSPHRKPERVEEWMGAVTELIERMSQEDSFVT